MTVKYVQSNITQTLGKLRNKFCDYKPKNIFLIQQRRFRFSIHEVNICWIRLELAGFSVIWSQNFLNRMKTNEGMRLTKLSLLIF